MTYSLPQSAAAKPAVQTIELQANAKTTQKIVVQAGQAFKIVVDGQVYTGQKKIKQTELRLKRKGDALLLVAEDQAEPLLEVSGFYTQTNAPADASADTASASETASTEATLVDAQLLIHLPNRARLHVQI